MTAFLFVRKNNGNVGFSRIDSIRLSVGRLGQGLLFVITLEAALMAGGRLLSIGPITVKMLLYLVSMVFALTELVLGIELSLLTYLIVIGFFSVACLGSILGVLNGAKNDMLLADLRAYAYVPAICFFGIVIRSWRSVALVSKAIRVASAIMFFACAVMVFLVLVGAITPAGILKIVSIGESQDFSIADEGVGIRLYYQGFIYLGIGAMFWAVRPGLTSKVFALMLFLLIVLSGTRGLIISLIICFTLLIALNGKRGASSRFVAVGLFVLALAMAPFIFSFFRGEEQVSSSNAERVSTINQVGTRITAVSLLCGHGLGIGVPERPEHMEITYLEIFHKDGLIGLLVWTFPFVLILKRYVSLKKHSQIELATPFALAVLLIAVDTFTNPVLNNPMGLSMVFISLSVFEFLHSSEAAAGDNICQLRTSH